MKPRSVWLRSAVVCLVLAAPAVLLPDAARAQSEGGVARADALFNAAKQLRDAGQYADACPSFAESKRLAPGVGVTLYLADCYEHVGKTGSAWKEFREAEALARERSDARAEVAHVRALALEPKLSGLTLAVPIVSGQEVPEVLLDGVPIPPEEWNVPMAVDPGDHVVTVNAHGLPARTFAARIAAGTRANVVRVGRPGAPAPAAANVLAAATPATTAAAEGAAAGPGTAAPASPNAEPAATGTAASTAPSEPAAASAGAAGGSTRTIVGLTLLGAGVIGAGVGTAFLIKYQSTANPPPSCTPPPKDTGSQVASAVAYAAGGVALISAMAVLLSAPHSPSPTGLVVAPVPMVGGGGAVIQSRF